MALVYCIRTPFVQIWKDNIEYPPRGIAFQPVQTADRTTLHPFISRNYGIDDLASLVLSQNNLCISLSERDLENLERWPTHPGTIAAGMQLSNQCHITPRPHQAGEYPCHQVHTRNNVE